MFSCAPILACIARTFVRAIARSFGLFLLLRLSRP
jgi:hypothetical protein